MKYIDKSLVNDQDYAVTCWVATEGSFNILTGKAKLKMVGWKNVETFNAKKPQADQKWIELELASLQSFEAVWTELATKLVTSGVFEGGEIKDTEEVIESP